MKRFAMIFCCAGLTLFSQTNRGSITGTITDSSGAAVAGVAIRITNLGTNAVRNLTPAANGTYTAADLDPVTYTVEFDAKGFAKVIVENVKVDTASSATVNVKLNPASVETKVVVSAESVMINTDSGALSGTITERQIRDIPLVNRSVLDLVLTLPNVAGDAGSENPGLTAGTPCPGCTLSIGGGRPLSSMIMADGTNNTGVGLARSIVSFTPETVQELTVQTATFSAEYGNTGGGVINVTTKSGTNELHGAGVWFNRNPVVSAAPFTLASTNRPVATLKYNQFSFSAGGPVYIPKIYHGRNKTFWFAAYEPDYRRDHLDQYGLLPTDAMRGGDFSGMVNTASGWLPQSVIDQFKSTAPTAVAPAGDNNIYNQFAVTGNQFQQVTLATGVTSYNPFPNNIIPSSMLDSAAQKSLPYIAKPGPYFLDSNGNISNILAPRLLQQDEKRYLVRVDHLITDSNRVYGRFTSTPIVKIQGTPVSPTNNGAIYSWGQQAMIADTHSFSPSLLNDLRLNYTRGRFSQTIDPQWDPKTGQNLNTALGLPSITTGGLPSFNGLFPGKAFGGGGSTATGFGGAGSTNIDDREERYGITDIVYKNFGSFSLKFGVDASHSLQNAIPLYGAFGGVYNFTTVSTNSTGTTSGTGGNSFASFLLGTPNGNPAVTMRNVEVPYYYRWNSAAAFIQNDWHVKRNLTLNLGLRYSLQMPRTEKYNHQGVFRPDLAQSTPLPAPLTLADGQVLNSTLQLPFSFSGIGGNSKYLTPPQYLDFEPRFGFAWSPQRLQAHHVTFRGGWGMSHAPISGFAELPSPDFGATANFVATSPSTTANPNYVMRLGENPPILTPATVQTQIYGVSGPPANGITYANSLYYQQTFGGFAVSPDYHTPYVNSWNFTVAWQATTNTAVEFVYTGAMGVHLFMGQEDINPKDSSLISAQIGQNVSTTATVNDPLGRVNPITGKILTVQNGSLGSPYLGYSSLYQYYDSSGNSIRHAAYINVLHRSSVRGLMFNGNYTYGKSIDDASSAGGDKNVLTAVNGQVGGQVAFGASRALDRSVSTFDQRHIIHGTALYDLPIGRGRQYLSHTWKPLDFLVGGWTTSALVRITSGFPYAIYLSDTNQLGDLTHSIRPDVVPGVPLLNPFYSTSCPVGGTCQPYLNPVAFERPALGQLGNAPRTFDGIRGPWQQYFDLSVQKNFAVGEKRRIQFRVDALNALNHPVFAVYPDNAGGSDFMGAPSTATLTTSAYNTWATANGQPAYSATTGAPGNVLYNQILNLVNTQKNANGALPANFFSIPLPKNFWATPANSYDITTLQGYKYYQLRNAYAAAGAASNFGTLYSLGLPRYIQFGIKFIF